MQRIFRMYFVHVIFFFFFFPLIYWNVNVQIESRWWFEWKILNGIRSYCYGFFNFINGRFFILRLKFYKKKNVHIKRKKNFLSFGNQDIQLNTLCRLITFPLFWFFLFLICRWSATCIKCLFSTNINHFLSLYNTFRAFLCSNSSIFNLFFFVLSRNRKKLWSGKKINLFSLMKCLVWSCLRFDCFIQIWFYIFWMSCKVASISSWSILFFSRSTKISSVFCLINSIVEIELFMLTDDYQNILFWNMSPSMGISFVFTSLIHQYLSLRSSNAR